MALICFILALIFFVVSFTGGHLTHDPTLAGLIFIAAGLAFTCVPQWWGQTPWRRNP